MSSIHKFPMSKWKQIWNRRGAKAVNCIVSDRWLKFGGIERSPDGGVVKLELGTPIDLVVMTDPLGEGTGRKLCSLIVTYEELRQVMDLLEKEMAKPHKPKKS